jgi:hypothetical protein
MPRTTAVLSLIPLAGLLVLPACAPAAGQPAAKASARKPAVLPAASEAPSATQATLLYRWPRRTAGYDPLSARIAAPAGFARVKVARGTYAAWLRHLPLRPAGSAVRSFAGRTIVAGNHPSLAAVVDLDLSAHDRQQCADTIMRLRGEHLFALGKAAETRFLWSGGKRFGFADWRRGLRPAKQGRGWSFEAKAPASDGYRAFRSYLEFMFSWTGTIHQVGEPRVRFAELQAGDFLIQGGSPGHAVVILDLARGEGARRGELRGLIGQGFMPAQDLHVLRADDGGAWFELREDRAIPVPLWGGSFSWAQLHRFRF